MAGLGPLTTTFTPASGCNSVISGIVFTQTLDGGNTTTHKYHSLGLSATSECYPPGFEVNSNAYYSPGICPSGWQSACGRQEAIGGSITETRVTCCPTYALFPRSFSLIDIRSPNASFFTPVDTGVLTPQTRQKRGRRYHVPRRLYRRFL